LLYTSITDKNFWSKSDLRHCKPCLQTLRRRLQWRNSNATVSRDSAATHFRCGG